MKNFPSNGQLARGTLVIGGTIALALLLWQLSYFVLLAFGAIIIAIILRGTSDLFVRWTPLGRRVALALAGLIIALVIGALAYLLGSRIISEFSSLSVTLPELAESLGNRVGIENLDQHVKDELLNGSLLSGVVGYAPGIVGALASVLLVVVAGVFLAIAPDTYRKGVVWLTPKTIKADVAAVLDKAGQALRMWLLGKIVAMIVIGAVTTTGLYLIGMPSPLALGLIAGVLEFIPFVGPYLSAVPALLVAASISTEMILWVIGLYVLIQQIENSVLVLLINSRMVNLPPVVGLFGTVISAALFGPVGLLLGTPLTIVAIVTLNHAMESAGMPAE